MPSVSETLALAQQLHRSGDLARAEQIYRAILADHPEHADSWHLWGVIATHQGRPDLAVERINQALSLRPNDAAFHLNLGVAQQAGGRLDLAECSFRRAIELQPTFVEALSNLANVLHTSGRHKEAFTCWRQAIALRPDFANARQNFASALTRCGQFEAAIEQAADAARLRPGHVPTLLTLGNALGEAGRYIEAESTFREVLQDQPGNAAARGNLARCLRRQGRHDEALVEATEAMHQQPDAADAHNEMGAILGSLGETRRAVGHLRVALALRPDDAQAHTNLGIIHCASRRYEEACVHLRKALQVQPDLTEASSWLGLSLFRLGDLDGALAVAHEAVNYHPGGPEFAQLASAQAHLGLLEEAAANFREAIRIQPENSAAHSALLVTLNYLPTLSRDELFQEHRCWDQQHGQVPILGPVPDQDRNPNRRLRIGYVSPDLVNHVVARFIEPVLMRHDPAQVELFCYADVYVNDATTQRLQRFVQHWRSILGQPNEAVAKQVRADRIDILVDLAGHTGGRLGVFARRPAPVQVTWLGYPCTTGLPAIQYRLTDAVTDPPGEPVCHTEKLIRLPAGFSCYQPPDDSPEVAPSPCLSRGYVTFGCVHKIEKLNSSVLDLWFELLKAAPATRLYLFRNTLRGRLRDWLLGEFQRRGIAPDRIEIQHEIPDGHFLDAYRNIDLSLDCFPWSGHATACESLWMGVPVLTLRGDRHAGRMVASVLTQMGLHDFIADSPAEYVSKAVELVGEPTRLISSRSALRQQMKNSPLGDFASFTRQLEAAYREMMQV